MLIVIAIDDKCQLPVIRHSVIFMVNHNFKAKKIMSEHNPIDMSESEEMYLITIARLVEQGVETPVPISQLASELSIQPVSANQMVHKLVEEELVEYLPYKGVQLTGAGQTIALQVLRDRRLWEVFLVEHLELPPSEADALACRLEHITSQGVADRLARFLGHPQVTRQGLPIPKMNGEVAGRRVQPLRQLAAGEAGEVTGIEADPATRAFLEAEGLYPGLTVRPLAIGGRGAMLVEVGDNRLHLSEGVTDKIMVAAKVNRNRIEGGN